MRFSSEGNAKKGGLEFHIHYNLWLDGKSCENPYFISIYNRNNETGLDTSRTYRFKTHEDAQQFCEEIASGKRSYDVLRTEYIQAEEAHRAEVTAKEDKKIAEYLQSLVDMDVDPRRLNDILKGYFNLQQEIDRDSMNRVFDGDIFWQSVSEYIGKQEEKAEELQQDIQSSLSEEDVSEITPYAEILTCVDLSKYEDMGLSELKEEQSELASAISNEKLWLKGSSDYDSIYMHKCNIASLQEELEYVQERIQSFSLDARISEAEGRKSNTAGDSKNKPSQER